MRIVVVHQAIAADSSPDEQDVLVQRDTVLSALQRLGHQATAVSCSPNLERFQNELCEPKPDLVFNLVESLGGYDRLITLVPLALDAWGIPYTGFSAAAIQSTTNKLAAKQAMLRFGLPTAAWLELSGSPHEVFGDLTWPSKWIRKPIWEHASLGMTDDAVIECADDGELAKSVEDWQTKLGRPCFAEQFISGREFNLSLLASSHGDDVEVLPIAEIEFHGFAAGAPRIVGYAAKWEETSQVFHNTPRRFLKPTDDADLQRELTELARQCWQRFRLTGYARVDFRVNSSGRPFILEINANPCLSPDAGFAAALDNAAIPFDDAVSRILNSAHSFNRS